MKKVTIHTDGGCDPNPGDGAWAAILSSNGAVKEISGAERATTNNRMELMAVIRALELLREPCEVAIFTDSEYLQKGISTWIAGWKRNGWRTATRQPVKNQDLWQRLDALTATHKLTWEWVKGHAGNRLNERCDELVRAARRGLQRAP